ncbi:MAG: glutaredoxin family protein [Candidatus Taylorbacteria bacterium]|nr:glutaredoxin family protein [Candidatus Taylorbacteria bacterium]
MKIIIYTKTSCPWCKDALDFLKSNSLPFEEREVLHNPEYLAELEAKSKQNKTPTFDIGGLIFPDSDVDQLRDYLIEKKIIS